ncbi:hypothetical protein NEOLEDRAFT_1074700, partial [Neolentinus lepideus HHB14362 ss-1]
ELPKAVKDIKDSWTTRMQAVAVVTALFTGVEATLLGYMTSTAHLTSSALEKAVWIFGYTSVFLNMGATLSSILLLVAAASLPTSVRRLYVSCSHGYPRHVFGNQQPHVSKLSQRLLDGEGETYLLRGFGVARGWDVLLRHCVLCFMGGWICAFVHIGLFVWLSQNNVVSALIMPSAAIAALPPLVIFVFFIDGPTCTHCSPEM